MRNKLHIAWDPNLTKSGPPRESMRVTKLERAREIVNKRRQIIRVDGELICTNIRYAIWYDEDGRAYALVGTEELLEKDNKPNILKKARRMLNMTGRRKRA